MSTSGNGLTGYLSIASADRRNQAGIGAAGLSAVRRAPFPKVMASPPTVTFGATFASSTITNAVPVLITDTRLRRTGCPLNAGTAGSNGSNYRTGLYTGGFGPSRYEFETDAPVLELDLMRNASVVLLVNGELAAAAPYTVTVAGASQYYMKVDFGSRAPRRLVFIVGNDMSRFMIGPNDTIWKTTVPVPPRVRGISDSIGQQQSTYLGPGGPFAVANLMLGWDDFELSAVGGTGFLNNNTTFTTFRGRISDVLDRSPEIIQIFGGINDQGRQTRTAFQAETTTLFTQLRAGAPTALLIAGGPWQPKASLAASQNYIDIRESQLASLSVAGGPWIFLDPLTGSWYNSAGASATGSVPWITGEGVTGATTGTGNADLYITDGTHPNAAGSHYAGLLLAGQLSEALAYL